MSNEVAQMAPNKLPSRLADVIGGIDANDDLTQGVGGGFAVVSFRGSKWRVKHGGEETLITNSETGEAVPSIQVVMLRANRAVSKNFYPGKYVEGSTDSPSCWSVDGVRPDPAVPTPVSLACASCPNNVFGSRITDDGRKAKACSDSRRLAVVPINDLANETHGGPMLLRVPAASLVDLAQYGRQMKARGFPYNTIVTRVGFDNDASYPKLTFKPVVPLTPEQEAELVGLLSSPEFAAKIDNVLATASEVTAAPSNAPAPAAAIPITPAVAAPPPADPFAFEQPVPAAKATAKKPTPVPTKKAAAPEKVAAAPVATVAQGAISETELDAEIGEILAKLDNV